MISTYPLPGQLFCFRRNYESADPVVRRAMRQEQPFRWGLNSERGINRNPSGSYLKKPLASAFVLDLPFQSLR
ncbi:autoinducer binding domain-containing protein [Bradyrhizobium tropiciagri]|uniref:autoinducer binding domain-containing protein n=1 Tax=Bradyrhizobium tropiciagri TaxID=312253 RepID=UPI001876281D